MQDLKAFTFCEYSKKGIFEFHESVIFIPSEKDSQIVITNVMATSSIEGQWSNPGYLEVWGSYYPNERFYANWTRRVTVAIPAGTNTATVDNVTNLSPSSIVALRCETDWTRQEWLQVINLVGNTLTFATNTRYNYGVGDAVIDISYPEHIPVNKLDPIRSSTNSPVGMVDIQGENLYTAPINLPLKVRMYGTNSLLVVSGYWKDSV